MPRKVIPITQEIARDDTTHHTLSPSGSARWYPCPGSVAAEAAMKKPGEDDSNEASRLGVVAHRVLELSLLFGVSPEDYIGEVMFKGHPQVDDEVISCVDLAVEEVTEYVEHHGRREVSLEIEEKVQIGELLGVSDEDCSGTPDVTIEHLDGSMLVVYDYKHGKGKVVAKDNTQLILYLAGARRRAGRKFKKYKGVIIQPRAGKKRAVEEWELTDSQLNKWLEKLSPSAQIALTKNAPRNAGEHCEWCRARQHCRTRKNHVMAVAQIEFDTIDEDPEQLDPERLSDEELEYLVRHREQVAKWLRDIEAYALKRLQAGERISGIKVAWSRRRRVFADEPGVVRWCRKKGLLEDEYSPRGLLTPAKLDTLLRKKKLIPRAKRGQEKPASPLEAFCTYTIPKLKVVTDDAADEFDEIDGDDE